MSLRRFFCFLHFVMSRELRFRIGASRKNDGVRSVFEQGQRVALIDEQIGLVGSGAGVAYDSSQFVENFPVHSSLSV